MATSVLNSALKTVADRAIRTFVTVTIGDDDYAGAAFSVPVGTPLTLVVGCTTCGSGTTTAALQGSVDKITWVTLKDIVMDSDLSGADLAAAGGKAETHLPSTGGDWPYYRFYGDMAASNGSAYTACILQG